MAAPHVKFDQLVSRCEMSAEDVRRVFDTVASFVEEGTEVRIHGFGTFRQFVTSGRTVTTGRIVERDGNDIVVPSQKVVKFKMSPSLKRRWNEEE